MIHSLLSGYGSSRTLEEISDTYDVYGRFEELIESKDSKESIENEQDLSIPYAST